MIALAHSRASSLVSTPNSSVNFFEINFTRSSHSGAPLTGGTGVVGVGVVGIGVVGVIGTGGTTSPSAGMVSGVTDAMLVTEMVDWALTSGDA